MSYQRQTVALVAVLAMLLAICYFPMLWMTGRTIINSDDMAYGLFAPFVALWMVWNSRDAVLQPVSPSSFWSLAFIGLAAALAGVANLASSSTFSRLAFLLSLAGCALLLGGWTALRRLSFPLALLLFTFPVPDVLYGELTQPLQLLATRLSESAFELAGFSVIRDGNILQLIHMRLSVVEACSGLRSLITLFFFCVVYAYFFESRLWLRTAVMLLSIPSAIFVNVLRITCTGVLGKYNMALTEGIYHEIVGWTAFALGFGLVLLGHFAIRKAIPQRVEVAG